MNPILEKILKTGYVEAPEGEGYNSSKSRFLIKKLLYRLAESFVTTREGLKTDIVGPDVELQLGYGTRCIAFKKENDDIRRWDSHREF